jgi:hypothetical protein
MTTDLLQFARGISDHLFRAFILDDQPATITEEQNILEQSGIESKVRVRPEQFVTTLQEWWHEREQHDDVERAEMRCVLIIDVFIQNFPSLRSLRDVLDVELGSADLLNTSTADGRWAGLVLIHELRKLSLPYINWPAIVVSAYGIHGAERRLHDLEDEKGKPPVRYLAKSVRPDVDSRDQFRDLSLEMLHDKRLYFLHRLANHWDLNAGQVCGLVGLQRPDPQLLGVVFDRGRPLPTSDTDQRVRALRRIHRILHGLLRDRDAQLEWLYARLPDLGNEKPIELMASGKVDDVVAVKSYLEFLKQ